MRVLNSEVERLKWRHKVCIKRKKIMIDCDKFVKNKGVFGTFTNNRYLKTCFGD